MLQADESHCLRNSHRQSCAGPPALSLFCGNKFAVERWGKATALRNKRQTPLLGTAPGTTPDITAIQLIRRHSTGQQQPVRQVALTECLNARSPVAEAASHHLPLTEHCIFARLTPLLGVLRRPGKSCDATQDCAQHLTVLLLFLPCIGVRPPWKHKGTASMWCRAQVNGCFTLMGVSFCFLVKAACRLSERSTSGSHRQARLQHARALLATQCVASCPASSPGPTSDCSSGPFLECPLLSLPRLSSS